MALVDSAAAKLERFLLLEFEEEDIFSENRALWSEVWAGMRLDEEFRPYVEERYRAWLERLMALWRAQPRSASRPAAPTRTLPSGWRRSSTASTRFCSWAS